ncbi:unnamed protein product [Ceratitis capitata]|uniref:(Mediterranean fruit fly) hypothetical protein n=1 Tax=Ceratitis capitata TaxID=7213 RepID=A0A811U6K1_CERCA|nr:unnamed protein product [Ceratitis capitata]
MFAAVENVQNSKKKCTPRPRLPPQRHIPIVLEPPTLDLHGEKQQVQMYRLSQRLHTPTICFALNSGTHFPKQTSGNTFSIEILRSNYERTCIEMFVGMSVCNCIHIFYDWICVYI